MCKGKKEYLRAPPPTVTPANALFLHYVSALKRFSNRNAGEELFQRFYHDHVIRGDADYQRIWEYIDTNPTKWENDCFYTE